ncbi:putative magnesium transporter NIPA1 [Diplonema papillatum]|nr:putative magnesium transporter NIPA1 [Diplonema papillatum]
MHRWIIGVLVSMTGTFSSGLGDNLVRYSYRLNDEAAECDKKRPYKSPWWVCGWTLTVLVDTGCNALALALAPLSLIMPLGALHILWGAFFARTINKEPLLRMGIAGCITIVMGVALVLASAPRDSITRSFSETLDIMYTFGFIFGQAFVLTLILCGSYFTWFSHWPALRQFSAPTVAGLFGASSNLMLKIVESLISAEHGDVFKHWEFWVIAIATIGLAVCQLTTLNHALATCEAVNVVPVANSVLLIGGTINGLVCFNDSDSTLADWQIACLSCGMCTVVIGIVTLSMRQSGEGPPPSKSMADDASASALLSGTQRNYKTQNNDEEQPE